MSKDFKFSTHLSILKYALEMLPKKSIEIGMGNFSTSLIYKMCKNVISVETSKKWYYKCINSLQPREGFLPILWDMDVGKSVSAKHRPDLYEKTKILIKDLYYNNPDVSLIFVDGILLSRLVSLEYSPESTDIIIWHDTSQKFAKIYKYNQFTDSRDISKYDWVRLSYNHDRMSFTDMLIRKNFSVDIDKILYYAQEHLDSYGVELKPKVEILNEK